MSILYIIIGFGTNIDYVLMRINSHYLERDTSYQENARDGKKWSAFLESAIQLTLKKLKLLWSEY